MTITDERVHRSMYGLFPLLRGLLSLEQAIDLFQDFRATEFNRQGDEPSRITTRILHHLANIPFSYSEVLQITDAITNHTELPNLWLLPRATEVLDSAIIEPAAKCASLHIAQLLVDCANAVCIIWQRKWRAGPSDAEYLPPYRFVAWADGQIVKPQPIYGSLTNPELWADWSLVAGACAIPEAFRHFSIPQSTDKEN
ncbi:hypothetical protein HYN69_04645 [Gemmobacter aquarius]|uniref:Uncharacterized protein n=1 Tax=Paragemmobacter aquarius TaxID=2169400 RepID=A0A2S0UJ92_9RHOB|nr:hypothetical protein HYN69_04645 [Gemmobacter aquarius]